MAVLAEDMVDRAVHALLEGSDAMARQVREDDDQLDRLEQEVDELAINLLAAGAETQDLRAITVGLKFPMTSSELAMRPVQLLSACWRSIIARLGVAVEGGNHGHGRTRLRVIARMRGFVCGE